MSTYNNGYGSLVDSFVSLLELAWVDKPGVAGSNSKPVSRRRCRRQFATRVRWLGGAKRHVAQAAARTSCASALDGDEHTASRRF